MMASLKWPSINLVPLNAGAAQQARNNFYPAGINAHPMDSGAVHREVGWINKHLEAIQAEIHINPVAVNPNIGRGLSL